VPRPSAAGAWLICHQGHGMGVTVPWGGDPCGAAGTVALGAREEGMAVASFLTVLTLAPPAHPGLRVLPSSSIPWACKVENELDPSHVLPCCHLVSFLFFRLK